MSKLIAANWKMFKTAPEARETVTGLSSAVTDPGCEVVLFAPFTALAAAREALSMPDAAVGGQNVYPAAEGAFTGEISPSMLLDAGCAWVLTGHSERRHIMNESHEFVGKKTAFALGAGLKVMLCIGETLKERENGQLAAVLARQLESALRDVPESLTADQFAVAYEPVWAIGTGRTATADDIVAAHALVRRLLVTLRGDTGREIRILYGGSVKPDNAGSILGLDNVGGLLVGGASLQVDSFAEIIRAARA
jgi:triosephosphate isomerase